ncbi:MAG: hypothetical protein K8J09_01240 [Planctomycetes bacterium]|nr:hypothetical protein [Planctomycetota bacterium]MCC7397867.1 hypothetical protein [Planctomycetota bacterium]
MNVRSLLMMLFTAVFAVGAAAQNCPKERTLDVPASVTFGPVQNCGDINYRLPGISLSTVPNGCPMFLIYTPPHQVAVPSDNLTQVVSTSTSAITLATFRCQTRWLIIIPIGSNCVLDQQKNVGVVQTLVTAPCQL